MRRGLISRSLTELPDAALDARLARLRRAMAAAGLDALIVYTNNTRPAAVSWLTGFVPYWSEALLVLPPVGALALVVALTFRVKPWIERTSRVSEVIHTPRIGSGAAKLIAGAKADATVGVVEYESLPIGIIEDLVEGGPQLIFEDATDLFAAARGRADPTEITLAARTAEIAALSLAALPVEDANLAGEVAAAVEGAGRRAGAEEIYVAIAPDLAHDLRLIRIEGDVVLGSAYAVRASVAYKGTWVRCTRTVPRGRNTSPLSLAANAATPRFAAAIAELPDFRSLAQFASYLIEGCRLTQPLEPLMGSRFPIITRLSPGAIVSVQATIIENGQPVLIGAPVLLGVEGEAASIIGNLN